MLERMRIMGVSVFHPAFTMVTPMAGVYGIDSPYHAARFVSLIPYKKYEIPGEERKEIWTTFNIFLAKVVNCVGRLE